MAQVTNITVSFERKKQPANFESAGAAVSYSIVLGDGENAKAVAEQYLGEVKTLVLTELGVVKAGTSASAPILAAAAAPKTEAPAPTQSKPAETTPAKKPTAAEKKAAKDAAAAAGGEQGRQISENPENRVDPANPSSDDDIPGEGSSKPSTTAPVAADLPEEPAAQQQPAQQTAAQTTAPAAGAPTHQELHAFIAGQIKDKKLDHPTVKAVSAEFKVARIADLKPDQLGPYKAKLDSEISRLAGNPDISDL